MPIRNASPEVAERLRGAGVPTTDRFVDRFYGEGATLDALLEILGGVGPGTTEVMCHPARVDDELRSASTYADERERELAALTDPEALQALERSGVRLAHFGALKR